MQTRLIVVVASSQSEGLMWNGPGLCHHNSNYHSARWEIGRVPGDTNDGLPDVDLATLAARHPNPVCETCGAPSTNANNLSPFGAGARVYDTPSGRPEPGCLYFGDWYPCNEKGVCIYGWTNCPGRHLFCILPNGHTWDIDSRASNCTLKDENTHRCWVRHGDPEKGEPVHVDKNGHTCAAGAGSIISGNWHGFLHTGKLT